MKLTGKTQVQVDEEALNKKILNKRNERNTLLQECDWTQTIDAPVDQAAWAIYRQALRDITEAEGWPEVEFPIKPIN
jgi:hypothetical protein